MGTFDHNPRTLERLIRAWQRFEKTVTGSINVDNVTIQNSGGSLSVKAGGIGTTQLADDGVTFAKMQNITTDRLLGRDTTGTGNVEEISVGSGITFSGALVLGLGDITPLSVVATNAVTAGTVFIVGGASGPKLKNSTGEIQFRNNADTSWADTRGGNHYSNGNVRMSGNLNLESAPGSDIILGNAVAAAANRLRLPTGSVGTPTVAFHADLTTGLYLAAAGTLGIAGGATFSGSIAASNFSGTSSGTNTGDQTITLTGAVTGSGTGSFATTLAGSIVGLTNLNALTTKGDLLTFSTVHARLPVGTDGYILSANSGTTTGLEWIAVGTGNVATDPIWDAKGDLAVGTGSNTAAKLTVGSNGYTLLADSAETTGIKWESFQTAVGDVLDVNGGLLEYGSGVAVRSFALSGAGFTPGGADGDNYYTAALEMNKQRLSSSVTSAFAAKLYSNTADATAIANDASEQNFDKNYTVPANFFEVGRAIRIRAYGIYSTTGTPTLNIRVKLGSTNIISARTFTTPSGASNLTWDLDAWIVCRSTGASGAMRGGGTLVFETATTPTSNAIALRAGAPTINTAASQVVQVSAGWSAADPANTITMEEIIVTLEG